MQKHLLGLMVFRKAWPMGSGNAIPDTKSYPRRNRFLNIVAKLTQRLQTRPKFPNNNQVGFRNVINNGLSTKVHTKSQIFSTSCCHYCNYLFMGSQNCQPEDGFRKSCIRCSLYCLWSDLAHQEFPYATAKNWD